MDAGNLWWLVRRRMSSSVTPSNRKMGHSSAQGPEGPEQPPQNSRTHGHIKDQEKLFYHRRAFGGRMQVMWILDGPWGHKRTGRNTGDGLVHSNTSILGDSCPSPMSHVAVKWILFPCPKFPPYVSNLWPACDQGQLAIHVAEHKIVSVLNTL